MRIFVDYKDSETGLNQLKIDSAKYLSDYAIRIKFSDGHEKIVDFKPFLSKSIHPSIKKYLDEPSHDNTIDTHADDYNFVTRQKVQYGYCWRFIPLFAGAPSDLFN